MQNSTIILGGKGKLSGKARELLLGFMIEKHFSPPVCLIFQLSLEIPPWKPLLPVILLIKAVSRIP